MPNNGLTVGRSWVRLTSDSDGARLLTATDYDVQNVGKVAIYLLEVSGTSAPADDDAFLSAMVLPPYWGTTVSEPSGRSIWALAAQTGAGRLSIIEA